MASQTIQLVGASNQNFSCNLGVPFSPLNFPDYYRVATFNPYCSQNADLEYQSCVRGANNQPDSLLHCANKKSFDNAA